MCRTRCEHYHETTCSYSDIVCAIEPAERKTPTSTVKPQIGKEKALISTKHASSVEEVSAQLHKNKGEGDQLKLIVTTVSDY